MEAAICSSISRAIPSGSLSVREHDAGDTNGVCCEEVAGPLAATYLGGSHTGKLDGGRLGRRFTRCQPTVLPGKNVT